MTPAEPSTENPPTLSEGLNNREYIRKMHQRLEGQAVTIQHLSSLVLTLKQENAYLATEVDKLALDLGIKNQDGGPRWNKVK